MIVYLALSRLDICGTAYFKLVNKCIYNTTLNFAPPGCICNLKAFLLKLDIFLLSQWDTSISGSARSPESSFWKEELSKDRRKFHTSYISGCVSDNISLSLFT